MTGMLEGKIAVVTGAGGGIGREIAIAMARAGVNARTAFSLLFRPILDEFGWDRGVTADGSGPSRGSSAFSLPPRLQIIVAGNVGFA